MPSLKVSRKSPSGLESYLVRDWEKFSEKDLKEALSRQKTLGKILVEKKSLGRRRPESIEEAGSHGDCKAAQTCRRAEHESAP